VVRIHKDVEIKADHFHSPFQLEISLWQEVLCPVFLLYVDDLNRLEQLKDFVTGGGVQPPFFVPKIKLVQEAIKMVCGAGGR